MAHAILQHVVLLRLVLTISVSARSGLQQIHSTCYTAGCRLLEAGGEDFYLCAGEEYLRDTRALLLRASLMQHDLVQRAPASSQAMRGQRAAAAAVGDRHFSDRYTDRVFL
jgi:hypothetical protein